MTKVSGKFSSTTKKLMVVIVTVTGVSIGAFVASCTSSNNLNSVQPGEQGRIGNTTHLNGTTLGNADRGKIVFRSETFGNEGFWTDAAKLPQGITTARLTPVQALQLGLSVNVDALDSATQKAVGDELAAQGTNGPLLNSFDTTVKLLNANAIIGVVVRVNSSGVVDVAHGSKVGVSCVLCHGITDGSVASLPSGGSIGKEVDGPANHHLAVGKIFAAAANTRAFYPMAQLMGDDGTSIGRAPSEEGLNKDSTEAEFDAYFSNSNFYPVGMFDDTVDGNGNPMHITPFFRQDLAAPYGSAGELSKQDHFANTVYTVLLDPTNLLSPGGKAFLHKAAGAGGDKLAADYAEVLEATQMYPKGTPKGSSGGYPYVQVSRTGIPGTEDTLIGIRVDDQKLFDMNAYVFGLRSPKGVVTDAIAVGRGKALFASSTVGCTSCHNIDNSQPVQSRIIDMKIIFPGDNPAVLASRETPLSPIEDTPGNTFDDKMIVINASLRGHNRGAALPLLMDLARKPVFLHDNSVATLDELMDPVRGANAPHPFYLPQQSDRNDMVQFLKSLDDISN